MSSIAMPEAGPPAPGGGRAGPTSTTPGRLPRGVWAAAAALVFAASTAAAFRQDPRPDPYAAPRFPSAAWWASPVETNAYKRVPVVRPGLNGVFALDGTDEVWAVGGGGLVLHTADGGATWERQRLTLGEQPDLDPTDYTQPVVSPPEVEPEANVPNNTVRPAPAPTDPPRTKTPPRDDPAPTFDPRQQAAPPPDPKQQYEAPDTTRKRRNLVARGGAPASPFRLVSQENAAPETPQENAAAQENESTSAEEPPAGMA